MAESRLHLELVSCLHGWIKKCAYLGTDPIVFSDSPDSSIQETAHITDGYRPDVHAHSRLSSRDIIGEAKTPNDLDTKHSQKQIKSFLLSASRKEDRAIVIATRWDHVRHADSLLKYWCGSLSITPPRYCILDQFGNPMAGSNDWF